MEWLTGWRIERQQRMAREVEAHLAALVGCDRVETSRIDDTIAIRRTPLGSDLELCVEVDRRGTVRVVVDQFVSDDDWRAALGALVEPVVIDVHAAGDGVHCFVLDSPRGAVLFMSRGDDDDSSQTVAWLRDVCGWSG